MGLMETFNTFHTDDVIQLELLRVQFCLFFLLLQKHLFLFADFCRIFHFGSKRALGREVEVKLCSLLIHY